MNRYRNRVFAAASTSLGLLVAAPASAASLQKVSNWGASGVPTYVSMYIYVPDRLATNPPIVVASHYCTGTAAAYFSMLSSNVVSAANNYGFIMIFPEATGQNCWDVGSTKSLTHDGGGDTQAVAQMVKYTISTYQADATRVYALGGSSGGMMTQALLGVYPDIFRAGAAIAGVPCGCWADGYNSSNQWSNNCAGGKTTKTAQQWGDLVRSMYPGYTGPRPRVQLWHGTADTTINYNNMLESIKEWTNVLGLSATSTDTFTTANATYTRQFWKNSCGSVLETWTQQNGTHSIPFDGNAVVSFFGLDKTGPDPQAACAGTGGTSGTGGRASGGTGTGGARTGGASNTGGVATGGQATGGRPTGGTSSGGAVANTGGRATGGMVSSGGVFASGGVTGGGSGGALLLSGGSAGTGGQGGTSPETCNCRTTESGSGHARGWLLSLALWFLGRARRKGHGRAAETVSPS